MVIMARLGSLPVNLPQEIKVEIDSREVKISGPKGTIARQIPGQIRIRKQDDSLLVERVKDNWVTKSLQGTIRAHLVNMIQGVSKGWSKTLELVGAGYRAQVQEDELVLTLGYSHPVVIKAPQGIEFRVDKNMITVSGIDKDLVMQTAANIRAAREPDPYKAKGVRYQDEEIKTKPGKQAVKTEGGA
jgi:large subunit ribosomal protein L6